MAQHLGLSLRTYADSEVDKRSLDLDEVARLSELGIDTGWLLTGITGFASRPADIAAAPKLGDDFILLPRYDVKASAGNGALIHSEQIVDYLAFKADWVRDRLARNPEYLLLIEASGDSMHPTIAHGDLLLVDRAIPHLRDSAIYVLEHDGELMVKRVERRLAGGVIVRSDNPRYEPEAFSSDQALNLRIVGQVVWHGGVL